MLTRADRLILVLPLVVVMGVFLLGPMLFGLAASLTSYSPFEPHPSFVGLSNYADLVSDSYFRAAFRTIGIFAAAAVALELFIGMAVAWLLREPFRGRAVIRVILLLPWLVSPIANGVMWHFLFESSAGIPNHVLALLGLPLQPSPLGLPGSALPAALAVEVWRTAPLAGFLLLPGFSLIPREFWEQATLEGAPLRAGSAISSCRSCARSFWRLRCCLRGPRSARSTACSS